MRYSHPCGLEIYRDKARGVERQDLTVIIKYNWPKYEISASVRIRDLYTGQGAERVGCKW